jgi:hypothetical protein
MFQNGPPPRALQLRLVAALAIALSATAGCGTPAGGDPGGRRLKELSNDAVFAALPPRASVVKRTRRAARYRKPGFEGGGWDGPSVSVMLKSPSPPGAVYRFYGRRAKAAGWHATAVGGLGFADTWRKTYPDGAPAYLSLALLTLRRSPSERVYYLAGGVAPVVH